MINNKRGIIAIPAFVFASLLIIASILIGFLLFSAKVRWVIIGIGVIIGSFIILVNAVRGEFTGAKFGVFILILLVGVGIIFSAGFMQTIFAISDITILGDGDKLLIIQTLGSGTENMVVELPKDTLNQKLTGEGWEVDKGIRIELDLLKFEEQYPLNKNQNEIFYKIRDDNTGKIRFGLALYAFITNNYEKNKEILLDECKINKGLTNTIDVTLIEGGLFTRDSLICYVAEEYAVNGQISGAGIDVFEIEIKPSGMSSQIMTRDNQVVRFDDDIEISFEGTIKASTSVKQVPYNILWKDGKFQHLISSSKSSNFIGVDKSRTYMSGCSPKDLLDVQKHENCMNDYNNDLDNSLQNRNNEFAPFVVNSLKIEQNTLIADVKYTQYPILRTLISGKFLGIERLSGIPKIVNCVSDVDEKSGKEIVDMLKIKNIGNQKGLFLFEANCDNNNFDVIGKSISINAGNTESITTKMIASSDKRGITEKGTCKITIEDKTSGKSDSCFFNVEIEFTDIICTPNTLLCSKDITQILKCSSGGDETSVSETCDTNEHCGFNAEKNQVDCISGEISPECKINNDCEKGYECKNSECIEKQPILTPSDCRVWEKYAETKTKKYDWWDYIGIGEPEIITEPECKTAGWVFAAIAGIIIIILGTITMIIFVIAFKTNKTKHKRRK